MFLGGLETLVHFAFEGLQFLNLARNALTFAVPSVPGRGFARSLSRRSLDQLPGATFSPDFACGPPGTGAEHVRHRRLRHDFFRIS